MKYLVPAILLTVGLINLYPIVGVISADHLERLYGLTLHSTDMVILMRHRAVLFGLLGTFIVTSAFRPSLQVWACLTGLLSMVTFVLLAYVAGDYGEALEKIVTADIIACVGLVVALALMKWASTNSG